MPGSPRKSIKMQKNLAKPCINIINARTDMLFIDRFSARPGEAWCIFGAIHSGVHEFFRLITGDRPEFRPMFWNCPKPPALYPSKNSRPSMNPS